jgi:hypothetical protein
MNLIICELDFVQVAASFDIHNYKPVYVIIAKHKVACKTPQKSIDHYHVLLLQIIGAFLIKRMVVLIDVLRVLCIFYNLIIVVICNLLVGFVVQFMEVMLNAFGYFEFIFFVGFAVIGTAKYLQTLIITLTIFVEPSNDFSFYSYY